MPNDPPLLLVFARRRLLVRSLGGGPRLAALAPELFAGLELEHFALRLPESPALRVADLPDGAAAPPGTELRELRSLLGVLPAEEARLAVRALHVVEWGRTQRYCGRCGARNGEADGELARRCPQCAHTSFPRISPAVIVLVHRGERVLLGRGHHLPPGLFSTLAGFVEPGESLEDAVRREIREEVGIELLHIDYFGSQPWPFPDSLMIGFTAAAAPGEVRIDPAEIAEAAWFAVDELPPVPPRFSIAHDLIASWVQAQGRDPSRLTLWPER